MPKPKPMFPDPGLTEKIKEKVFSDQCHHVTRLWTFNIIRNKMYLKDFHQRRFPPPITYVYVSKNHFAVPPSSPDPSDPPPPFRLTRVILERESAESWWHMYVRTVSGDSLLGATKSNHKIFIPCLSSALGFQYIYRIWFGRSSSPRLDAQQIWHKVED